MFSADEQDILNYLKPIGRQFVSAKEVCRRAGGKMKYLKDADWAKPVMKRMEKKGVLEMNEIGHYRIKPEEDEEDVKRKIPLDPRIRKILLQSGKDFTGSFILEDDGSYTQEGKPPGGSREKGK